MALTSDGIAILIATFSAVGFTIDVAIPTVSSTFFQLLQDRDEREARLLRTEPAFRIIERFSKPRWVVFYSMLALTFIVPGLLILLEALLGTQTWSVVNLQTGSLVLLIIGMVLFVAGTFYVILRSTILLPEEARKLAEYLSSAKTHIRHRRPQRCRNCGAANGKSAKFCKKCGTGLT